MKTTLALVTLGVLLAACTNPETATRVLTSQGFTDVKMTGYSFLACSKDDFYHTGFTARSVTGMPVAGTVCEGFLFKNSTVRFE